MHFFFRKNSNPSLHIDYFTNCTFWWLSETTRKNVFFHLRPPKVAYRKQNRLYVLG